MKRLVGLAIFATLSGCAVIDEFKTNSSEKSSATTQQITGCWFNDVAPIEPMDNNCDVLYWLEYWVKADDTPWPQRAEKINTLGDGLEDTLHKIILSQPVNTPYQARLRAQHWIDEITPSMTPDMTRVLQVIVTRPSEHMLEFESAVTVMNRMNNEQDKTVLELQEQIKEQQKQIQDLLNIETNLMGKSGSDDQ